MKQFLAEIRAYAEASGNKPGTIVQQITGQSGTTWKKWEDRLACPRYDTVLKIRRYIADNRPPAQTSEDAA